MSLYTFATDALTTFADRRRRPAIDAGQLARTLALFVAFAIALALATHHSDASDSRPTAPAARTGLYAR